MQLRRSVVGAIVVVLATVIVNLDVACSAALSSTRGGLECGQNPMHAVQLVAQRTGRPLTHVLEVLRYIDRPAFDLLAAKFREYASCVGVVDTGYFRRRRDYQFSTDEQLDDNVAARQLLTL